MLMPGEAARSGAAPAVLGMAGRPRSARALKMAPALTGLEVKELCIGITLSKKSDTRPLPDDGPLQRGEAQGAQLSFST